MTSVAIGLQEDLLFRTKGQLAIDILAEAFADGVRLDFVSGDEVYGSCTELREYLEDRDQAYVLRVPCSCRTSNSSRTLLGGTVAWWREVRTAAARPVGDLWPGGGFRAER